MRYSVEGQLLHYGVKGMKWGVRKEYEAKGRKSTARISDTGNKKSRWITTDYGVEKIHIYDKSDRENDQDFIDFIKKRIPDRYAPTEEARKKLDNLPKYVARLNSTTQQVTATNHNRYNDMRRENCFQCSMAYEMRRRGYNVQAKETRNGGWQSEVAHAFDIKDAFTISIIPNEDYDSDNLALAKACYKRLEEQCLTYGNGARGCLAIQYYDYDSGHSMAWVVEDGIFKIVDSQGMENGSSDGYEIFLHAKANIEVARLDNAEALPGVTDFIEPFEATDEEKEKASKKAPTMPEAEKLKNKADVENARQNAKETNERVAEARKEAQRSIVEKAIRKIGNDIDNFVSKGKEALRNIFHIKRIMVINGVEYEIID